MDTQSGGYLPFPNSVFSFYKENVRGEVVKEPKDIL
jgi:hypothetical protein